ncbi:MAG: hypothetical protein AAF585_26645, partial [Verrucomicrobiota bacterium]
MPAEFQPTRWSLIQQAAAADQCQRESAWVEFDRLYRALADLEDATTAPSAPPPLEVLEGLTDDLNTPRAIAG